MANENEVANFVLTLWGQEEIESLNEENESARKLRRVWPLVRKSVLRRIDWNFARTEKLLAPVTDAVSDYAYAYAYPADCVEAREIYNSTKSHDADNIDFGVRSNASGNGKIIVTDQYQAVLFYTRAITVTSVFCPLFVEACGYLMAAMTYKTFGGSAAEAKQHRLDFLATIGEAGRVNKNEYWKKPNRKSCFELARG
ncbi:MAG: hypothetical protein PHV34_17600 [Verrucomicrobiae bacterium]|nr:hypothetical protein [Verrucomicrobiae bacterium]